MIDVAKNPTTDTAKVSMVIGILRGQLEDGMEAVYALSTLEQLVNAGICSKDKRLQLSEDERIERVERAEDKARKLATARNWFLGHAAPSYDKDDRNSYKTVAEIMDAMGIPHADRKGMPVILNGILASRSTGWGLVAESDGKKFYAASARLIQYEPPTRKAA